MPRSFTLRVVASALAAAMSSFATADVVAQWDFNAQSLAPSIGSGTLSAIGGVSGGSFNQAAGSSDPTQPGFGWQTSGYPSQGQASGSAGIELKLSTLDWTDLSIRWDQRHSNTSSRWVQLFCSTDNGLSYSALDLFEATAGDTWFNQRTVDLSAVPGASNNASLTLRIVSVFAPGLSQYAAANAGSNYSGGTWRFDMISVHGTSMNVPAPGALGLLGLAGAAGGRRRRAEQLEAKPLR